jgi:hypothetical protein
MAEHRRSTGLHRGPGQPGLLPARSLGLRRIPVTGSVAMGMSRGTDPSVTLRDCGEVLTGLAAALCRCWILQWRSGSFDADVALQLPFEGGDVHAQVVEHAAGRGCRGPGVPGWLRAWPARSRLLLTGRGPNSSAGRAFGPFCGRVWGASLRVANQVGGHDVTCTERGDGRFHADPRVALVLGARDVRPVAEVVP